MTPFALELPATIDQLAPARGQLRAWLASEVADESAREDLLAVAGEFFLHVVYRTGGVGHARVLAERGPGGVRLSVTAAGDRAGVRALALSSDPLAAGAIGRRLVDGCCDDVRVSTGTPGGVVGAECFRRLTPAVG